MTATLAVCARQSAGAHRQSGGANPPTTKVTPTRWSFSKSNCWSRP